MPETASIPCSICGGDEVDCDCGNDEVTEEMVDAVKDLLEQVYWADGCGPDGIDYGMTCALRDAFPHLLHGDGDTALEVIVHHLVGLCPGHEED